MSWNNSGGKMTAQSAFGSRKEHRLPSSRRTPGSGVNPVPFLLAYGEFLLD